MFKTLIFAGTTEGRMLAEFCAENGIPADISAATDYGASLLPKGVGVLSGRLDEKQISDLLGTKKYHSVIDATHPYASEVTENIKKACKKADIPYYRLLRESSDIFGETAESIEEITDMLDRNDSIVLSTLGSKSVPALAKVKDRFDRIWLRLLPSDGIKEYCKSLGFDENKIILEKGPFGVEENMRHIRSCGAEIMLTKESGKIGGYPEKAEAAKRCGIKMITLCRPKETGYKFDEMTAFLMRWKETETN